jgi:hypothetical protein
VLTGVPCCCQCFPVRSQLGKSLSRCVGARKGNFGAGNERLPDQLAKRDKMSERMRRGVAFWLLGGTGVLLATWQFALIVIY